MFFCANNAASKRLFCNVYFFMKNWNATKIPLAFKVFPHLSFVCFYWKVTWHLDKVNRSKSPTAATSKMERIVIIVNVFRPLTIITKRSILDVAAVLHPPLEIRKKTQRESATELTLSPRVWDSRVSTSPLVSVVEFAPFFVWYSKNVCS